MYNYEIENSCVNEEKRSFVGFAPEAELPHMHKRCVAFILMPVFWNGREVPNMSKVSFQRLGQPTCRGRKASYPKK